ncbi:TIGR01777 family oxidoreductase [Pedobacter sp. Hv1]|uniref:TIGR01777 family oxidoreductase n=1 Tax=Pedobacter sp. Hv1 TaxID=1740090 RepID=UPI0006D898F0|nr:TIGR01777 family oxidoreductase [Pedobacter sp. Hv1]KQC00168.1 NAD-dependent epimerase [Pedobacter sp. Hv1]
MYKKVVIAGGTGFIGKYLAEEFCKLNYQVLIISRQNEHIHWNNEKEMVNGLESADLLINLAGKSVDCRYNKKNKEEIIRSRTETTKLLGNAILKCKNPPKLWINSSTATIYRHATDQPMTESTGEIGNGFSVDVAKSWEQEFFSFELPDTRQVALRIAIVLGKNGGVMKPFTNLVCFGLGGKQGSGDQMFSWIHIEDLLGIILFLQLHEDLNGVFNCAAPNPIDNKTLMKCLRQTLGVKIGLPAPVWLLKIGAIMIRTETELILKSRWVVPEKLLKAGYDFKYQSINIALADILNKG